MSAPPDKQRVYAARHRAKHGERMRAEQRELYRTDAEYRQSVIDRAHDHHELHKDEINAERRDRYQNDPAYRDQLKSEQAAYRERLRAGHVPSPPPIHRTLQDVSQRVYRTSEAARRIGCSNNAVKRWYSDGWIPTPDIDGEKLMTAQQIELLKLFYAIPKHDHDARSECSKIIFEKWSVS